MSNSMDFEHFIEEKFHLATTTNRTANLQRLFLKIMVKMLNAAVQKTELLGKWLKERSQSASLVWLEDKVQNIKEHAHNRDLFLAFSAATRFFSSQPLNLSAAELADAEALVPGWRPCQWTEAQTARALLLLSFPALESNVYAHTLEQLITAADLQEAIAFYQALPLLPEPEQFCWRASEGIRSNVTAIFNAVAHYSPYPARYFDELAWNQMVLKALFIGSPLEPIYGLVERNNLQLGQMLIDYAQERLAAERNVSPELWSLARSFQSEMVAQLQLVTRT